MHCRCILIPIPSISFAALATSAADSILFPQVSNSKFYLDRRRQSSFVLTAGQASTSKAGGNGVYRTPSPVRSSRPQRLAENRRPKQKQAAVTGSRFGWIDQPRAPVTLPPSHHLPDVDGRTAGPDLLPGSPWTPLWSPLGWVLASGTMLPDGVTVGPDLLRSATAFAIL